MKLFDAHFHIIERGVPLEGNRGYIPEPFGVEDYLERVKGLNVVGGAVVAGSFHGSDYTHILRAIEKLGSGFVGVINPVELSRWQVEELNLKGIRGIRFNVVRCGKGVLKDIERLAYLAHDAAGWHVELYVENRMLKEIKPLLASLPAVCIDHLGLTKKGFDTLLELAREGVRVKASGFGRAELCVKEAIRELASANPHCLLFGTDLPSTRSPRPFSKGDVELVKRALPQDLAEMALYRNALEFYRP